jgi:phosphoribosylaminoimidazolecarboxamide formyltransferase/IMP cyclohydrolase
MIRAAAKNYQYVTVLVNPASYDTVIQAVKENGEVPIPLRKQLAEQAYRHTSEYDAAISAWLAGLINPDEEYPKDAALFLEKVQELRYGENPHQTAAFYREKSGGGGIALANQLHGKELSFNNIVDLESAYRIVSEFEKPAVTIIKHTNPCGTGLGQDLCGAYKKAFDADPVSAFGGVIGLNRVVDAATAKEISDLFAEALIAPGYDPDALAILTAKKNLRLLQLPLLDVSAALDIKKVTGGFLVQKIDDRFAGQEEMRVVTKHPPTPAEWEQLLFALKVVKHVKSNAILLAKEYRTTGVGAGQMNRVGAARIAIEQAGELAKGSVLASDAFFPFSDTVEAAAQAGITAIIQPGGSVRDEESIAAADQYGLAMVFSGLRHFKH